VLNQEIKRFFLKKEAKKALHVCCRLVRDSHAKIFWLFFKKEPFSF